MQLSIKTKVIVPSVILIILSIIFPTLFLSMQFKKSFENWSAKIFTTSREVLITGLGRDMLLNEHRNIQQTLQELAAITSISHLRLFNRHGIILHSTDSSEVGMGIGKIIDEPTVVFAKDESSVKVLSENKYASWGPVNSKAACVKCHHQKDPIAYFEVETNLSQSERFFRTGSVHIYFLAIALILLLIIGFYVILQYFFGARLNRFVNALKAVEKGELDKRLPATGNDEIGFLESQYNRMVEQIQASLEKIDKMHNENISRADKMVTLGELTAEMAHEVNNPTAIIMSRADFLLMECDENPSLKPFRQDLEVLIQQTENISKITNNILKYSKKLPSSFSVLKIVDNLEESLALLEPRLKKRKITVHKDYQNPDVCIKADELQMQQVFTNIINNSIDAIGPNGQIYFHVFKKEKKIYIIQEDNGPGIDPEISGKIFLPFFSTKMNQGGTGLGLYVVKNILANYNAEITCENGEAHGCKFTIKFDQANGE